MLFALAYVTLRSVCDLLLVRQSSDRARAIELLALRQEVRGLRRQVKRTSWRSADRPLLAALSRCLPRGQPWRFPVRPETVLR